MYENRFPLISAHRDAIDNDNTFVSELGMSRRHVFKGAIHTSSISFASILARPSWADFQSPKNLEGDFILEQRVIQNQLSPPNYGLEGVDIFYP
jgi:hypothetical protein